MGGKIVKLGIVATAVTPGFVDEVLDRVVGYGFETVKFSTGTYSGTPCSDRDVMVAAPHVARTLRAARVSRVDSVFIAFTNFRWSDMIATLEWVTRRPAVTANESIAGNLLRRLGSNEPVAGHGMRWRSVCQELIATGSSGMFSSFFPFNWRNVGMV